MKFEIKPFLVEDKREHTLLINEDNSYTAHYVSAKVSMIEKEIDFTPVKSAILYITLYDDGKGDINNSQEKGIYKVSYEELYIKNMNDEQINGLFGKLLFGTTLEQKEVITQLATFWGITLI